MMRFIKRGKEIVLLNQFVGLKSEFRPFKKERVREEGPFTGGKKRNSTSNSQGTGFLSFGKI